MAQQTKSRSSGKTRSSTRSKSRNSKPRTSTKSRNGSSQNSKGTVAELAAKAKPVSRVASKVKTPLVAGGAALAGLAGGVALKSRTEHRRPVGNLRTRALSKVDLDKVTEMGRRLRSFGEQVGDLADAADKTRKKHK